jgi:transposase InsO family protein
VASRRKVSEEKSRAEVKPWVFARASFRVKPADRGAKERRVKLKLSQEALNKGISRAPYVNVKIGDSATRALVDTGADWSLLDDSMLSVEERENLAACDAVGQGVGSEPIDIVGEVWKDVEAGGTRIPGQRFVVVRNMVTDAILGADFWVRLGEMTFNFRDRVLKVERLGLQLELFDTAEPHEWEKGVAGSASVRVEAAVRIPPFCEQVVTGRVDNKFNGCTVLIEPVRDDDRKCSVPYTLATVREGTVVFKVANASGGEMSVLQGDEIAWATPRVGVLSPLKRSSNTDGGLKGKSPVESVMWGKNLQKGQQVELRKLLEKYQDVFYDGGELPLVRVGIEHNIRLRGDNGPIAFQPRRLSREAEKEVRSEIEELVGMGVIRPSNSPWAAPIVCARRQDGSLRLALDYRALNAVSLPATLHPIPRIDDLMDRLAGARYFAVLDAKCGYHQMPLCEQEAEMTAFVVPWGHFEFRERTPFGLKGAGYSFQRFMSVVLEECNYADAVCYLDDILVWGATWQEFMVRLDRVMGKVSRSGLALSAKKCSFGVDEVKYLGAVVKDGAMYIGKERVEQLRLLPTPGSIVELRRVLGAFAYVQRWLPGLADVNKPLYDLLKEHGQGKSFRWNTGCEAAFAKLKELLAEAVSLRIPKDEIPFTLVTDASGTGVGAMLAQKEGDVLVPVAFYHHAMTPAEMKYDTTEKELLAVVKACTKWRVYLDSPFDLITDHNALRWLNTLNPDDARSRRGRWIDFLQQFEINVIHKKGKSSVMSMADYLSRVKHDGDVATVSVVAPLKMKEYGLPEIVGGVFDVAELIRMQAADPEIKGWVDAIQKNWVDVKPEERPTPYGRMYVDDKGLLRVRFNGGKKTKQHPHGKKEVRRVVFPKLLYDQACRLCHDTPLAGHMGIRRTWKRVRDSFWWEEMRQDVTRYVNNCERCGKNKHSTSKGEAPIQETDVPVKSLDKIQVDFVGPFGVSTAHDYRYALQVQDVLSRYVVFIPTVRSDATTAAVAVFDEWVCKFGFPLALQSDHGRHFTAQVFEEMCKLSGISHKMGSVGHAQSQGLVERQNQLLNQVRALCDNDIDKWPTAIYRVQHAHNIALNATTKLSPHEVMFGQAPRTPEASALMEEKEKESVLAQVTAVGVESELLTASSTAKVKLKSMLTQICRDNVVSHQKERTQNQTFKGVPYKVGDFVRLKLNSMQKSKLGGKKIAPRNTPPFMVIRVTKKWTYELVSFEGRDNPSSKVVVRHYNELVPCRQTFSAEVQESVDDCYWLRRTVTTSEMPGQGQGEAEVTKPPSKRTEVISRPELVPDDRDTAPEPRYPRRDRKPAEKIQLSWRSKTYETVPVDEYEMEEESEGSSEYEDAPDVEGVTE